jgi:hypothetical protein
MTQSNNKFLHHLGVGVGFTGLILWGYIADRFGLFTLLTDIFPETHAGAALMVGIMLVMAPGFFIWKHYNRWLEKRLKINGRYYEDDFYKK